MNSNTHDQNISRRISININQIIIKLQNGTNYIYLRHTEITEITFKAVPMCHLHNVTMRDKHINIYTDFNTLY